jgi:hypothetical protein
MNVKGQVRVHIVNTMLQGVNFHASFKTSAV